MHKDQPFHLRFGVKINADEAYRRFLNRVNSTIFYHFDFDEDAEEYLEHTIAFELGEEYHADEILTYVRDDFHKCLQALEIIYDFLRTKNRTDDLSYFQIMINRIFARSEIDFGINFKDGKFFPAGAKELDSALVEQPLNWLRNKNYESVLQPYEKGLDHYLHSLNKPGLLSDVVTDIYEAMEALAKIVTRRFSKDLSANKQLFISNLGVSPAYQKILTEYINFANEFRHATIEGKPKKHPPRNEVESFIYLTGIFLRLAEEQDQITRPP